MNRDKCMKIFSITSLASACLMLVANLADLFWLTVVCGIVACMLVGAYIYDFMLNYQPAAKAVKVNTAADTDKNAF